MYIDCVIKHRTIDLETGEIIHERCERYFGKIKNLKKKLYEPFDNPWGFPFYHYCAIEKLCK